MPVLLADSLERRDLWEEAESGLARVLRKHPELGRALLEPPSAELAPADAMLRSFVLEERGEPNARAEARAAYARLYTAETIACQQRMLAALVDEVRGERDLVVDLASGRGMLVELLVDAVHGRVLATDLSPRTLRRVRAAYGVGVAALDARQMPFRDGVVPTMTTFVGIANVEQPGELMRELRRVVGRRLLAICSFYPEGDGNADAIAASDSGLVLYREPFLRGLREAGFDVRVLAYCAARAEPTPRGVLLEGATIDALPVVTTDLEWALIEAR